MLVGAVKVPGCRLRDQAVLATMVVAGYVKQRLNLAREGP